MNKSAQILVVDDEPDTLEVLSRQLSPENYKVLTATSGKKSLELLKKHKPDLILMDLMMPGMDGFETIKIIRDTIKDFIPIIIVTATRDDTESITRGFSVGADDYIVIPCNKGELLARIRAMLRIKELHDNLKERNQELAGAYNKIKETHEQLVHAGKMVAIGQLSAGAAHEINNPLAAIIGFTEAVLLDIKNQRHTPDEIVHDLEIVLKNAGRCKAIMSSLLTFARAKEPEKQETDINSHLNDALSLIEYKTKAQNIKVIKRYEKNLCVVNMDRDQMTQVFVNFISNAQNAMPDGGELLIRTWRENNFVGIEFKDTGAGIEKENLSKIFDPFFTTSGPGKGIGLGLSLSYSIIKRHEGNIKVSSEGKNKGASFIIEIPAQ
ncbi:response regulator [Candidatus Peregrinibacteria bacterium]|nr:response regulator [Candidatus Peregrinibacteria bacterium]